MKKALVFFLLFAVVLTGAFAQSQKEAKTETAPAAASAAEKVAREKMVYGLKAVIADPIPFNNTTANNIFAYRFYLENLVKANWEANTFEPFLAESYEISADGLSYTFHLRDNVVFHNGKKCDAAAVKASFELALTYARSKAQLGAIESIEVVDDRTIVFHLSYPDSIFLNGLASGVSVIVDAEAVAADPDLGWRIGTGPYTYDEYVAKDHTTFNKFEGWWGDVENIKTKTVEILQISEGTSRAIGVQTGELDFAVELNASDVVACENDPGVTIVKKPSYGLDYLVISQHEKAPAAAAIANVHFRRALCTSVDTDSVIAVVQDGVAVESANTGIIPVGYEYYTEPDYYNAFDMDKAQAEMAQARAEGVPENVTLLISIDQSRYPGLYELLKEAWGKLGVNLEITTSGNTTNKLYDIQAARWTPSSLQGMMNSLIGTTATSNRSNCYDYMDLVAKAATITDAEAATAIYREINKAVIDNCTHIPMYGLIAIHAVGSDVENFSIAPAWANSDFTHAVIYE